MSVRTMARVWAESGHAGTGLLMMLAIADFADDEGNAYPAVTTLAAKCRMKPRNANYILASLQASGELEVRQNEGPRGTNRYRIVFEALRGVQGVAGVGMQPAAGVQGVAGLQSSAQTPAMECAKPLQPIADEPSENHQEPEERSARTSRSRSAAPGSRLPADWKLSPEDRRYCLDRRPDLDADAVAEAFRDYWLAAVGPKASKASWSAAWRSWVRNEKPAGVGGRRSVMNSDDIYGAGV